MIRRYKGCRGIVVFRWGRRQLEIWFCPADTTIESHVHHRIDSRIFLIWGKMIGTIGREAGLVELPKHFLKPFRVPPGMKHSARTIPFTIFGNWEIWKGPVSSAATDFTAV